MTKGLAVATKSPQKTPATAMSDALPDPIVDFSAIPALVEIEEWIKNERGVTWRPEFEARINEVSLSLFGVKRHPKPKRFELNSDADFNIAEWQWQQWQAALDLPQPGEEAEGGGSYDLVDYLDELGIYIWDTDGNELRCAEWFVEQAIAAVLGVNGARLTLDGSGGAADVNADEWGAALGAEAAKFRSRR